jgi:hypothetical protein
VDVPICAESRREITMTIEELLEFIGNSMNKGLLYSCDLIHIGTKKYQTHVLSASNQHHELVLREFTEAEDTVEEGVKTDE